MALVKTIVISSADKDSSSATNSDFTCTLKERYLVQSVNKIILKQALVPNCFYNVTDGKSGHGPQNNYIEYQQQGEPFSIVSLITPGFYNINDLMIKMKTVIDANLTGGTVINFTYSDITGKITWTMSGGAFNGLILIPRDKAIYPAIGFDNLPMPGFTIFHPFPLQIALNGMTSVFIHCSISENSSIDSSAGITSMCIEIPFDKTPFGNYASWQSHDGEEDSILYENARNLSVIDVRLRTITGERLDIGTKTMSLTFRAYLNG